MTHHYLVVAANGQVREELPDLLRSKGHSVALAANAAEAESAVTGGPIETVVIEAHLPDIDASELQERLQQLAPQARVLVVSSFDLARRKPAELLAEGNGFLIPSRQLLGLLVSAHDGGVIAGDGSSPAERGNEALLQVIDVLVGLHELDDRYFGGSSHQVMTLVRAVAEELLEDPDKVHEVVLATLLRDVGKVAVEPEVIDHAKAYDPEHRRRMNEHVHSSLRLFEHIDFPWRVLSIIRHHHERYDGSGYPDGLRGREIPMGARVIAVVDTFVAMTSHRAHRPAWSPDQALQDIIRQAGQQFDPEVIEAFQRVLERRARLTVAGRKPLVLLIEPDEDFRNVLMMRLLNEGFEVKKATSNDKGLERVLKHPPDLLLVDVDTDAADTFQLLREMRDDANLSRIPFVMLSRSNDRVLKLRALREGVDEFLSRDLDLEQLVAHVQNVIAREGLRRGDGRSVRRGIAGELEHLGLPEIVQTLVIGMKTACVSLVAGDVSGKIWFENGTPKHAVAGSLEGEPAFYEMLRWSTGEFVIEHGVRGKQASLKQDAMFLLMEGMRLLDESSERGAAPAAS